MKDSDLVSIAEFLLGAMIIFILGALLWVFVEKVKIPETVTLSSEVRRYRLITYRPPKRFYVTLQDVQTGQVYDGLYVSKRCGNYLDNKIGDEYNITVIQKQKGDRKFTEFENLYGVFC